MPPSGSKPSNLEKITNRENTPNIVGDVLRKSRPSSRETTLDKSDTRPKRRSYESTILRQGRLRVPSHFFFGLCLHSNSSFFVLKQLQSNNYVLQQYASEDSVAPRQSFFMSDVLDMRWSRRDAILEPGTRVIVNRYGIGWLRYVGSSERTNIDVLGVELECQGGDHDGEVNGRRYFRCPPGRGVLVPPEEVKLVDPYGIDEPTDLPERARGYIELRFRHRLGAQAAPAPLVLTTGNLLELTGWYFALQHVTQSNLNMTSGSQNEVKTMLAAFREKPDRFGVFRHWLATPWFHGPIAREEAERRLRRTEPKDGCFIVRESLLEKKITVSFWWKHEILHALVDWVSEAELLTKLDVVIALLAQPQPSLNWNSPLVCYLDKYDIGYEDGAYLLPRPFSPSGFPRAAHNSQLSNPAPPATERAQAPPAILSRDAIRRSSSPPPEICTAVPASRIPTPVSTSLAPTPLNATPNVTPQSTLKKSLQADEDSGYQQEQSSDV